MKVFFEVPIRENGFWIITNFLSCFIHADNHVWINIELANIVYDEDRKRMIHDSRIVLSYPIDYIMYFSIGDEFDLKGRPVKRKEFKIQYKNWEAYTEPIELESKVFNHKNFDGYDPAFPWNSSSDGVLYYDLYDLKSNRANPEHAGQKQKKRVIAFLPLSLVGQYFYFLGSDLNELLYNNGLRYILRHYNSRDITQREGDKIGKFFYEYEYCKDEDLVYQIGSFLFSKEGHFINSLHRAVNHNVQSRRHDKTLIPFNYEIPIKVRLKLKVRGRYYKGGENDDVFFINEILDVDLLRNSPKGLFTIDKIQYQPDQDFYPSGDSKPNDSDVSKPNMGRPKGKDSTEIRESLPSNSTFKPRNIRQTKNRFFGIIPMEKDVNSQTAVRLVNVKTINNGEESDGDTLNPTNDNNGRKRRIKTSSSPAAEKDEKNAKSKKTYLSEVMKKFRLRYGVQFTIFEQKYEFKDGTDFKFIEFNIAGTDLFVYFIDAFDQRIQVISKVTGKRYHWKTLTDIADSVKKNTNGSWQEWKNSNYIFEGMKFGVSINKGSDDLIDENFYQNEADKFFNRISSIINKG